ncbi:MAG: NADH-quinone oxidoreductase subunit A [Nitrospinota bacterium]|nr:MAG: NADH-quinone oxidoreductase subunit A [Nitrospinota bacterium]
MESGYFALMLMIAGVALLVGAMLYMASALGPKRRSPIKEEPFECGMEPISLPSGKVGVHFYLYALLFIIFDLEVAFLFPWAVVFREISLVGLLGVVVYLGIALIGLLYAWKRGALEWA